LAHDAYTRLLQRLPPDSDALWAEVSACIDVSQGMLVIDDTTLDKPDASKMALVSRHWSGASSMRWTEGDACLATTICTKKRTTA